MTGRSLMVSLKSKFDVLGISFSRTAPGLRSVDLRDPAAVEAIFAEFQPQAERHMRTVVFRLRPCAGHRALSLPTSLAPCVASSQLEMPRGSFIVPSRHCDATVVVFQ